MPRKQLRWQLQLAHQLDQAHASSYSVLETNRESNVITLTTREAGVEGGALTGSNPVALNQEGQKNPLIGRQNNK